MTTTITTLPPDDEPPAAPEEEPTIDLRGEATPLLRLAKEVWRARELMVILTRKEFHVRYRRASLGVLWAIGLPLLQSVVMAVVFSHVAHIRNAPHYAIFVLSGMTAWVFFSTAIAMGSTSIVDGSDLSSRVYFPRVTMPLVQVASNFYGYGVTVVLLLVLCPILGVGLGPRMLLLVPASVLLALFTVGFCLVTSALHVYFRDIRYMVAASLVVWMYITPVVYPSVDAPGKLHLLIDINPMTGVVDLFHAATVGQPGGMAVALVITSLWAAGLLACGIYLQCRRNRVFADLL